MAVKMERVQKAGKEEKGKERQQMRQGKDSEKGSHLKLFSLSARLFFTMCCSLF